MSFVIAICVWLLAGVHLLTFFDPDGAVDDVIECIADRHAVAERQCGPPRYSQMKVIFLSMCWKEEKLYGVNGLHLVISSMSSRYSLP